MHLLAASSIVLICWQLQTVAAAKPKLVDILEEAKQAGGLEDFLYHSDGPRRIWIRITDTQIKDDKSGSITYSTTDKLGFRGNSKSWSVDVSQTLFSDASVTAPANEYEASDWSTGVKNALEKLLGNAVTRLANKAKESKNTKDKPRTSQ